MMNYNRIHRYFEIAKNTAFCSDNLKTRVGCVIIYKKQIISTGWNLENKTHPLQKMMNKYRGYDINLSNARHTQHAECHALVKIDDLDIDWSKVSIFNYRIKRDGSKGMSKPCKACEAMLRNKGIKEIYFTTETGWGYEQYESEDSLWPI